MQVPVSALKLYRLEKNIYPLSTIDVNTIKEN